jgi:hypothetical protein
MASEKRVVTVDFKPWDAIREGAKKKKPCASHYFREMEGQEFSCAIGAGVDGRGDGCRTGDFEDWIDSLAPYGAPLKTGGVTHYLATWVINRNDWLFGFLKSNKDPRDPRLIVAQELQDLVEKGVPIPPVEYSVGVER